MPDLAAPEYASYIELCHEIRPRRRLRCGDLVSRAPSSGIDVIAPSSPLIDQDAGEGLVWIPRIGDWFDLLEEIGTLFEGVCFSRLNIGHGLWRADIGREYRAEAPTREEAIARLWVLASGAPSGE